MTTQVQHSSDRAGVPLSLCVVVPCLDEEAVLPDTLRCLETKLLTLVQQGVCASRSCILVVDDGSTDATWSLIEDASAAVRSLASGTGAPPLRIEGMRLAHNEGHQVALYAGLMWALDEGFDCAISIDADLQDDIDAFDDMLCAHRAGAEVVYGVRSNRDADTPFKRWTARSFYRIMRWLGAETVADSADFRLMGKRSLSALSRYHEVNLFLRGIVPRLGFSTATVSYARRPRRAGVTKYTLGKMVGFALEGITSFSIRPIRWVSLLGVMSLVIGFAMMVYTIVSTVRGDVVAGWASLMISIWLVGGLIMLSLGIVGEYIGKIYLEAKGRPRYIIEKTTSGRAPEDEG